MTSHTTTEHPAMDRTPTAGPVGSRRRSAPPSAAERATIRAQVASAARVVATTWPLSTFVAVNPLGGLQDHPFDEAVRLAGGLYGTTGHRSLTWFRAEHARGRVRDADLDAALRRRLPDLDAVGDLRLGERAVGAVDVLRADLLHGVESGAPDTQPRGAGEWCDAVLGTTVAAATDDQVSKWLTAFCGAGAAAWSMPGGSDGLWSAWRRLVRHDPALRRLRVGRARLRALPDRAEDALIAALSLLRVPEEARRAEFRGQLVRTPGWAAHIRWRAEHPDQATLPADLVDLLAIRLTYELLLVECAVTDLAGGMTALRAEVARRTATPRPTADPSLRVDAVLRALDAPGSAAAAVAGVLTRLPENQRGFVWLDAYEWHERDTLLATLDRPAPPPVRAGALAQAAFCIDARSEGLRRHLEGRGPFETFGFPGFFHFAARYRAFDSPLVDRLCPVPLTPSRTAEERPTADAAASVAAARAGRRDAVAGQQSFHAAKDDLAAPFALAEAAGWVAGPLALAKTVAPRSFTGLRGRLSDRLRPAATEVVVDAAGAGRDTEEQVDWAEFALRSMGLLDGFAPLVVLCGHGSRTENNAFEAALDCGACGGQHGGPNARAACAVLNRSDVRAGLARRGIVIGDDTLFLAAEHDTATDVVTVLDRHAVPERHREALARLEAAFADAGQALATERAGLLPGGDHPHRRARDWAQVRPEWGLARHTAFVIGPSSLVRGLDLGTRTFLHSYDAAADPDARVLETILTAPGLVVQWINAQYYFSTVAPDVLGAGDKTLHNVVADIGVLQGQSGDLRLGLPWQSVAVGEQLHHEPVRALYVIEAPLARVDEVIGRNPVLQQWFHGQWLGLVVREGPGRPWQRRTPEGGWEPWQPAVTTATPSITARGQEATV